MKLQQEKVQTTLITSIILLLIMTTFVGCEAPNEETTTPSTVDSTPSITIIDTDSKQSTVVETPEELENLVALNAGDYESECVDGEKYMIEIKESWNGEKVDLNTNSFPHNDCYMDINDPTTYSTLTVDTFTSDDFYGQYTIYKDGDTFIINDIEFKLKE